MAEDVTIPLDLLRGLLDLAADTVDDERDFNDAEVRTLRRAAFVAGIDPNGVTPRWLLCRFTGEHPMRLHPRNIEEEAPGVVTGWCYVSGVQLTNEDRHRMIAHIIDSTPPPTLRYCPRCGKTEGDAPPLLSELTHRAALDLGFVKGPARA